MFKKNFSRICFEKGLKPTAVCMAVGLSNAAYSGWDENSTPRKSTIQKLAAYLDVTVDDLLNDENPSGPNSNDFSPLDTFTPEEITLIHAWRSHPEFHDALRKMLDMPLVEATINPTA